MYLYMEIGIEVFEGSFYENEIMFIGSIFSLSFPYLY